MGNGSAYGRAQWPRMVSPRREGPRTTFTGINSDPTQLIVTETVSSLDRSRELVRGGIL